MAWVIGADTDLPLNETLRWDGPAAAARVFELAMFDSDEPDLELARRAFLVYDDERPELRGSYKLGIADVVDGELVVLSSGLRAAASRLPQTADLSEDVVNQARAIIDDYVAEMRAMIDDEEDLYKIMAPVLETKFDAPAWLRANARRGLEWHREGLSGDGVVERTIREARAMADGFVSEDKAVRMAAWFARHMGDLDAPAANPDHEDYPSPGVVAHALWGGGTRRQSERAQRWAEEQVASMERSKTATPRHERKAGFLMPSSINGRTVTGIFSVFGNMDSYADVIHNGAFSKTLSERAGRVLHLWQHDMDAPPIALIDSLREVPRQALPAETLMRAPTATGGAEVTRTYLDTPRATEVLTAIQSGAPLEMSFAFDAVRFDFEENADSPLGVVRNLRELKLYETSDVNWGANSATIAAKARSTTMPMGTLLHALRAAMKAGARHSTRDTQLINSIAEAAIELGATSVRLINSPDPDEERAARVAPALPVDGRERQLRVAAAALALLNGR
jgi:HK97 family phage prohead protease